MNQIIKDILPFLNRMDGVYFELVSKMVEPVFDDNIDTACVDFSAQDLDKNVGFRINKKFWKSLNYNEKCFVFIHEVFHVLFSHGKRGNDFLKTLPEKDMNFDNLNIAEDICINEILLKYFFNELPVSAMPKIKDTVCTIESVFGDLPIEKEKSFDHYYNKIMENSIVAESFDKQIMPSSGEGDEEDSGSLLEDALEEMDELIREITGEKDEENFRDGPSGNGYSLDKPTSRNKEKTKSEKTEKNIQEYIKLYTASSEKKHPPKRKTNWYGTNRRTAFAYSQSDLIMPIYKEKKQESKHNIVCYCDFSGSCDRVSRKFVNIIEKLDQEKYDITIHLFAGFVSKGFKPQENYEYTYDSIGCGTNINSVLWYHEDNYGDEIDGVFVLTDGEYNNIRFHEEEKYSKWHFFMIGSREKDNVPKFAKVNKI